MDKIQEIMGLVDQFAWCVERSVSSGDSSVNYLSKEAEARKAIESALRELVEQTFHQVFEDGCESMEED